MKDGYIPHKDDLFLIHGPGGVGKSSLISMFLGKERDLVRVSTTVAEESLHLCPVRDVSNKMYTDKWETVDIQRQVRMIAHTSRHLTTSSDALKLQAEGKFMSTEPNKATTKEPFLTIAELSPTQPRRERHSFSQISTAVSESLESSIVSTDSREESQSILSKLMNFFKPSTQAVSPPPLSTRPSYDLDTLSLASSLSASMDGEKKGSDDPHEEKERDEEPVIPPSTFSDDPLILGINTILSQYQDSLHSLMFKSSEFKDLVLYHSIRVIDSGGQPQFHEVVSIILPAVTGIVSVFKLSEPFNDHGEVVFYNKAGKEDNDPYKSYLTNEQVIRHDLLAIQSVAYQSGLQEIPSLAFVGTFLDEKHKCPSETPNQKDKRLHDLVNDILPKEMHQCVISNGGSLNHVTFCLNARQPSERDYRTTAKLKEALMRQSRVKPKNLPLKWCSYEVALCKVMEHLGCQTLSKEQCELIGYNLGFDSPSLKACLHYLRKFHIISFYDCLPGVIFGSCQVILDKITELVTYSLQLKKGGRALNGIERKFHQQGILSLEILQSEACSKHYKEGLFSTEDLLKVLKSLLIVTEVGEGEYLMPCVLEVSDIYPSPPVPKSSFQSSFVLHFSKESPMIGIYCCTISYLLTEARWKLLTEDGDIVQVARNSVIFQMPKDNPGKLIFLDPMSSYLEVVVELPLVAEKNIEELFREIRHTFTTAVMQAMKTLNYEVKTPKLSFLCPEQSDKCPNIPHLANINASYTFLTCSKSPATVAHPLSSYQRLWLPDLDDGKL